ncbi:MAG: tRNA pseudouridine(55) synthase TruB [Bacillota bacterium]|nr:tRNA pseudouridine(55) synthase TruB [Bacillota bacterium]
MKDGILVLNKPQEWTSSDCVAICRRVLGVKGIKKVGHGGTLDPMATGVLPIFVGQATRIMEYMDLDYKTYLCEARFGLTTDTLDIWGEVIEMIDWSNFLAEREAEGRALTREEVVEALMSFKGSIEQIPPMYSAVRINGKRLYEYAYKGKELSQEVRDEIKKRKAYIKRIELGDLSLEEGRITFLVECSKGTYIRTICHDLGQKLGCGCTMTGLIRTAVGNIAIDKAGITAEDVKNMDAGELEGLLLPPDYPLVHFGIVYMPKDRADYFSRGNSIRLRQIRIVKKPNLEALAESGRTCGTGNIPKNARGRSYQYIYKVYEEGSEEFLGTGYLDEEAGELKADKVFVEKR